ncbi:MAG: nucleoside triphosphate pyrophosphohydrolase [Actinobacteria bacterium]|nr:nucleoside triphosphate pyrophosphohydrolase [Actinomycetota bacterium]
MKIDLKKLEEINNIGELFGLLAEILKYLRSPNGCIWDRDQDHDSIKKNIIEEAYEAVEAIEYKDYQSLREELGDLLLQIVFQSQIAIENNEFSLSDVIKGIIRKLYRRHPHVFGDKNFNSTAEILNSWEEIKKSERKENPKKTQSIFNDIPKILPSLHYAYEIQNRASRLGFDWQETGDIFDKIKEETEELVIEFDKSAVESSKKCYGKNKPAQSTPQIRDEVGDILFSIVNLSRHLGIDSEQCLKKTCTKFMRRFNEIEKLATSRNIDFKNLPLKEKDKLWNEVKKKETKNSYENKS